MRDVLAVADNVAATPIGHSAILFWKGSIAHGRETDRSAPEPQGEPKQRLAPLPGADADDFEVAPPVRRAAVQANGYKPGTRKAEPKPKAVIGEIPWWSRPRGDAVREQHIERLRATTSPDIKNLIGWKDTGLTGGACR